MRLHGRIRELDPGTSVQLASPQNKVWMRHVGDPLAFGLEVGFSRRNSRQVNGELLRFAVQADQIDPALLSNHKQFLSIHARSGIAEQERPHGQLGRLTISLTEKRSAFANSPNVLSVIASRFKE